MGFALAIKTCLRKYTDFSGRAARPEFWYFVLFLVILNFLIGLLAGLTDGTLALTIGINFGLGSAVSWPNNFFSAIFTVPFLSAASRRLNDAGVSSGKVFAVFFLLFAGLSLASKATSDNLPSWLVITLFGLFAIALVYLLARKTVNGIEGNPSSPAPTVTAPPPSEVTP
jgi:uncharacterized membrane protein YhaH (DUF805 family)